MVCWIERARGKNGWNTKEEIFLFRPSVLPNSGPKRKTNASIIWTYIDNSRTYKLACVNWKVKLLKLKTNIVNSECMDEAVADKRK